MAEVDQNRAIRPLISEQLLIDHMPEDWKGRRALVVSPGRAQLAEKFVASGRFEQVGAWYVDLHDAAQTAERCDPKVDVICGSDLPLLSDQPEPASVDQQYKELDLVAMPLLKRGEAEFTRDVLQQAHASLNPGGYLAVSVDNAKDQWLHDQMRTMFSKVTNLRFDNGCVYWGRKQNDLKKVKNFDCQFDFRDADSDRILQVVTRPGVFSHRRLDPGAKQLILAAEIAADDNVLELGCGSGAVSFAAAARTQGQVYSVDGNARAIDCVERGAKINELQNVNAIWNADGDFDLPNPIDIALANPPYYGDDSISQHFVDTCVSRLRPGGAVLVVTKQTAWYEQYFTDLNLEDLVVFEAGKYFIVCGRRPL